MEVNLSHYALPAKKKRKKKPTLLTHIVKVMSKFFFVIRSSFLFNFLFDKNSYYVRNEKITPFIQIALHLLCTFILAHINFFSVRSSMSALLFEKIERIF